MAAKAQRLVVRGTVQMVGYRRYVVREAARLGVKGYVRNLPDMSVEVIAKAEERVLSKFVRAIGKPPEPATVESIARFPARFPRGVSAFTTKFGSMQEELQEGFGGMETQFRDYRSEFRDYRKDFDGFHAEFRDYRKDFDGFHAEFRDYRRDFDGFHAEFRDYRSEFKGFTQRTDENFAALGGKLDSFAARTDENFRALGEKYGEISSKLSEILATLLEQSRKTQEMLEAMRSEAKQVADTLNESLRLLRDAVERLPPRESGP